MLNKEIKEVEELQKRLINRICHPNKPVNTFENAREHEEIIKEEFKEIFGEFNHSPQVECKGQVLRNPSRNKKSKYLDCPEDVEPEDTSNAYGVESGSFKELEAIEKIPVKDRTNEEHFKLIRRKYNGKVRDYLLSMGDFKDVPINDDSNSGEGCDCKKFKLK